MRSRPVSYDSAGDLGHIIEVDVLQRERADYAEMIVASLVQQLMECFGRGFSLSSLYPMVKFARTFPDKEIVASLGPQLSWTHFKAIIAVQNPGSPLLLR